MNNELITYLHDHLAGAKFAIEILDELAKQEAEPAAARVAMTLRPEIESDRGFLEHLLESQGGQPRSMKNVASWIAERASRLKLSLKDSLGVFEAVEFLCLGVLGKLALWHALEAAKNDQEVEFTDLKARAAEQHASLEAVRLKMAAKLFPGWDAEAKYLQQEEALGSWAKLHGIEIGHKLFSPGKAGEFEGLCLRLNSTYRPQDRLYYAAHAIGSIAIWSRDKNGVQQMFDELRDAKKQKASEVERFVTALERYRKFEADSSSHAIWILQEIGAGAEVGQFTNQMRADLEAMTQFHEIGQAPVWDEYFARWNREVAAGERSVEPFDPKPVADFQAVKIETQEIVQRQ